jgi:hypothetical protein
LLPGGRPAKAGYRRRRVKVKIAVKVSDGKTYKSTRTYRTCAARK